MDDYLMRHAKKAKGNNIQRHKKRATTYAQKSGK